MTDLPAVGERVRPRNSKHWRTVERYESEEAVLRDSNTKRLSRVRITTLKGYVTVPPDARARPRKGGLEASMPTSDVPMWVQTARNMRSNGYSYQQIADALGTSYRRVYVALNRERVKATNRASDARRKKQKAAYDRQRGERTRLPCPSCGRPMSWNSAERERKRCKRCIQEATEKRDRKFIKLWADGLPGPEIAKRLGMLPQSVHGTAQRLRNKGHDLAYRYARKH